MSKNDSQPRKEAEFALSALMEILAQYKATIELGILGRRNGNGNAAERFPLPTPMYSASSFSSSKPFTGSKPSQSTSSYKPRAPAYPAYSTPTRTAPSSTTSNYDSQTCCECGQDLQTCPICRSDINTRIKLY